MDIKEDFAKVLTDWQEHIGYLQASVFFCFLEIVLNKLTDILTNYILIVLIRSIMRPYIIEYNIEYIIEFFVYKFIRIRSF